MFLTTNNTTELSVIKEKCLKSHLRLGTNRYHYKVIFGLVYYLGTYV